MVERSLGQRPDFRALVDRLDNVAIWIVSEPGEFDYVSGGFEEIFGVSAEVVVEDPDRLLEFIHPDDRKEAVFGKGTRGMDSPGTGIGLYLVRTIVEQCDGEVWLEDNEPRGAAFNVKLPLAGDRSR